MTIIDQHYYFDLAELVKAGIRERAVINGSYRGVAHWQTRKSGRDGRVLLVRYDTMKERYRAQVLVWIGGELGMAGASEAEVLGAYLVYCNRYDAAANIRRLVGGLVVSEVDRLYFGGIANNNGVRVYTPQQVSDLALGAAILRYLGSDVARIEAVQWGGYEAFLGAWCGYLKPALGRSPVYGLSVSCSKVLRRRVAAYGRLGNVSMVSEKIGNQNTVKMTDACKLYTRLLYRHHRRHSFEHIARLLNEKITTEGWGSKPVSADTVAKYLNRADVKRICALERYDKRERDRLFHVTVKRFAPTQPHDMWVMDGTPAELYWYDGKRFRRELVFVVIDAHSWAVLGWHFGTETKETVMLAVKAAYRSAGCMPLQLQFDHSSGAWNAAMEDWYKQTIRYITPAEVGNAKSKVVEPWFSHFHLQVIKPYFDGFAGMNVKTKRIDNQAHYDWLKRNRDKLPQSREACMADIERAFVLWNTEHKVSIGKSQADTPYNRLTATPHRARLLDIEEEINAFWLWRMDGSDIREYTYTQSGIRFDLHKESYEFRVYDSEGQTDMAFWTRQAGAKFRVKYDPSDLSMIALYDPQERFVTLAQTVIMAPMAIADYTAGSGKFVQGEMARRRQELADAKAALAADNELLLQLGWISEEPSTDGKRKAGKRTRQPSLEEIDMATDIDAETDYNTAFTLREVKDVLNESEEALKQPDYRGLYQVTEGSMEVIGVE